MNKPSLRRTYRAKRRALTVAQQAQHAEAVGRAAAERLNDGDAVAVYLARDGEVQLAPLIDACWRRGIVIAVPVIEGPDLRFAAYRQGESMTANRFGIAEPAAPIFVEPNVVLTPLVAFDDCGRRLGMGGGFYDRYFTTRADVARIGIAHECQRAREIPIDASDVPLCAVVTERGWQRFASLADTP